MSLPLSAPAAPRSASASDAYKRIVVDGVRYYGKHLLLSAASCGKGLLDIATVRHFITDLVEQIDMRAYGPCIVERFGSGAEIGLSGVQLIETSAITLHTNDASRDLYLDVFSCKTFDEDAALNVVRRYFEPASTTVQVLFRK
jgi:S-adenosylmethionine/arginine decarboxylase-like enzyme